MTDRALLFAGGYYYPAGGWCDMQASGTVEEVMAAWDAHRWLEAVYAEAERAWQERYPGGQWKHPDANKDYQQLRHDHPYGDPFDWAHLVVDGRIVQGWDRDNDVWVAPEPDDTACWMRP